jgi:RNA polymerase sigma-70 factor, ECF subfamily
MWCKILSYADEPASTIASMALTPEWTTELAKLDDALQHLRDAQRVPWQLRYVEGYRIEEVADLCHCSLATVKRRIAQAAAHIRKYVKYAEARHD